MGIAQSSVVLLKLRLQACLDISHNSHLSTMALMCLHGEWSSGQERAVCKFGKMGVLEKKSFAKNTLYFGERDCGAAPQSRAPPV